MSIIGRCEFRSFCYRLATSQSLKVDLDSRSKSELDKLVRRSYDQRYARTILRSTLSLGLISPCLLTPSCLVIDPDDTKAASINGFGAALKGEFRILFHVQQTHRPLRSILAILIRRITHADHPIQYPRSSFPSPSGVYVTLGTARCDGRAWSGCRLAGGRFVRGDE